MRSADPLSLRATGFPSAAAVGLVAALVATYAATLQHPFVWDDGLQIAENPAVTRGAPLSAYFLDPSTTTASGEYNTRIYRPLRNLAYRAIAIAAGVRPAAYHAANLALYVASVLLVLLLVLRTFRDGAAAAWAAALWAFAPVHTEPVCYASALGDLLSLALALGGVLLGLGAMRVARLAGAAAAGSAALTLAAMLAKEMAVTVAALLALCALLGTSQSHSAGERPRKRIALLLGAHGVVLVAYLVLRTSVIGRVGQEAMSGASLLGGLREAPVLLFAYLQVMLAPLGHNTAYFVPQPPLWGTALALCALAAVARAAVAVDRRFSAPPGLRLGLGWIVVALLPVLHIVPLWAHVADRFALLPSVGVALCAGWAVARLPAPRKQRIAAIALGPLVLLYLVATVLEQRPWRSELDLWLHATREAPRSGMAHFNLARVHLAQGRFAPALAAIDRALSPNPDAPQELWLMRAISLDGLGRAVEAERAAAAAQRATPESAAAHALYGDLRRRRGDLAGARASLARAQGLAPGHPSTRLLEAELLNAEGRKREAATLRLRLAEESPRVARFRYLAATAALETGDAATAAREAEACVRLEPGQLQCAQLLRRARELGRAAPRP